MLFIRLFTRRLTYPQQFYFNVCVFCQPLQVCKKLDSSSPGSVSIDASCDVTQRLQCKPVEWNEPQRIDIKKILNVRLDVACVCKRRMIVQDPLAKLAS